MALEPSREGAEVRIFTPDRFGELEKYAKELPNILSGNR